jgi:hypothetical protein
VYELRIDDREDSTGSQLGGDAPHYPMWVYNRVIIPRLLWEEAERRRQVEARQQPVSSSPEYNDIDLTDASVRVFSSNYDFEWWIDSDSEETQVLQEDNNSKSEKNDKNLNNTSTKTSPPPPPPKTKHKNRNWSERFIEVKARRQKIEEEKLTRILKKIEERNKRLEKLKKK